MAGFQREISCTTSSRLLAAPTCLSCVQSPASWVRSLSMEAGSTFNESAAALLPLSACANTTAGSSPSAFAISKYSTSVRSRRSSSNRMIVIGCMFSCRESCRWLKPRFLRRAAKTTTIAFSSSFGMVRCRRWANTNKLHPRLLTW